MQQAGLRAPEPALQFIQGRVAQAFFHLGRIEAQCLQHLVAFAANVVDLPEATGGGLHGGRALQVNRRVGARFLHPQMANDRQRTRAPRARDRRQHVFPREDAVLPTPLFDRRSRQADLHDLGARDAVEVVGAQVVLQGPAFALRGVLPIGTPALAGARHVRPLHRSRLERGRIGVKLDRLLVPAQPDRHLRGVQAGLLDSGGHERSGSGCGCSRGVVVQASTA
jgi:hypothetical protein